MDFKASKSNKPFVYCSYGQKRITEKFEDATVRPVAEIHFIVSCCGNPGPLRVLPGHVVSLIIVPANISECTCLQDLSLHDNCIVELPKELFELVNLTKVNLEHNEIAALPLEMKRWKRRLTYLALGYNSIKNVDVIFRLSRLTFLSLCHNEINIIPDGIANLTKLKELDLSNNTLTTLPESLPNLPSLQKLNISNNQLSNFYLEGKWSKLEELKASGNPFPDELSISLHYFGEIRKIQIKDGEVWGPLLQKRNEAKQIRSASALHPVTDGRAKLKKHRRGRSNAEAPQIIRPLKAQEKRNSSSATASPRGVKNTILSGTIEQFLSTLLAPLASSVTIFQWEFVLTYPTLIDDQILLDFLLRKYAEPYIQSIINVLLLMVTFHKYRFSGGSESHHKIIEFITQHCNHPIHSKSLLAILGYLKDDIISSRVMASNVQLANLSPKEMAKQLCIIELRILKQIRLHDLVDKRFEKGISDIFVTCSDWFNLLSSYVKSCILVTSECSNRTVLINRFIGVAHKCISFGNFNSAMALYAGVSSTAILRMKASWKGVSVTSLHRFQELEQLFDLDYNFHTYRTALRQRQEPCIPVTSLVLHDLVLIEETNGRFIDKVAGILNFERCSLLSKIIYNVHRWQQSIYEFTEIGGIREQFSQVTSFDDKVFHSLSQLLEPKNISSPKFCKIRPVVDDKVRKEKEGVAFADDATANSPVKPHLLKRSQSFSSLFSNVIHHNKNGSEEENDIQSPTLGQTKGNIDRVLKPTKNDVSVGEYKQRRRRRATFME